MNTMRMIAPTTIPNSRIAIVPLRLSDCVPFVVTRCEASRRAQRRLVEHIIRAVVVNIVCEYAI